MPLFHIATEIHLTHKPDWLDAFRKKYDKPYPPHMTLKVATVYRIKDIPAIKKDFFNLAETQTSLSISFQRVFSGPGSLGWCLMLAAKENIPLHSLQKKIVAIFSPYGKPALPLYQTFENSFNPHLTIARNLTKEKLAEAEKNLGTDTLCHGALTRLTLTFAQENTFSEWNNPKNKITLPLKNHS